MNFIQKIISPLTRAIKYAQIKAFKLTYNTNKLNFPPALRGPSYQKQRGQFWKKRDRFYRVGLNFYLDGRVEQFFNNESPKAPGLWFEAVLLKWGSEDIFNKHHQYLILIGDYDSYYEALDDKMQSLSNPFCSIIAFNPPGVGSSPGAVTHPLDYQTALQAIIDELLAKGIHCRNITLMGHGFGGAIAVTTALPYHQNGQFLGVIADRTFSSSARLAATEAQQAVEEYFKLRLLKKIFGTLAYYVVYGYVYLMGMDINVAQAFTNLNPAYARCIVAAQDAEIPTTCNLVTALTPTARAALKEWDFECRAYEPIHDADLQTLILKQHSDTILNSAHQCILKWVGEFKQPEKPGRTWEVPAESKVNSVYATSCYCVSYIQAGLQRMFAPKEIKIENVGRTTRKNHRTLRYGGGS